MAMSRETLTEAERHEIRRAMRAWNSMTRAQRSAALTAAQTACPAEAMRHLGYRIGVVESLILQEG